MEQAQYTCLVIGIIVAVYGLVSIIKKRPPMVNAKDIRPENLPFYGAAIGSGCVILGLFWAAWSVLLFSPSVLLLGSVVVIAGILIVEKKVRK